MDQLLVYSALSLPAVSAAPSSHCLQWSGDGQALLLTKSAVYILTPETGVHVERSGVVKQTLDSETSPNVGWLRTMIEFDKTLAHQWPADCQEWGAVALGSLDPGLRAATPSPSNMTADGLSVIALLNSNMELTIWGSVKNHLRGQWAKLQTVSADLFRASPDPDSGSGLERTLEAQITCIEWSSQADFYLAPSPNINGSLLAAGNRAGSVTFLRYDGNTPINRGAHAVGRLLVCDRWVSHLAWSSWKAPERGSCEALLACGSTDGSITVVRVIQTLEQASSPVPAPFIADYEVKLSFEIQDMSCEPDGRSITALRWINVEGRSPILLYCKPGLLCFWSGPNPVKGWSGSRAIRLQTQRLSVGASALCCVSGIVYIRSKDMLVVSLSDGSFHAVYSIATEPSITSSPAPRLWPSSESISAAGRSVFLKVEPEDLQFQDVNCVNGMTSYDDHGSFVWVHEASRPTDFSYKHDAKHVSMFVVAQLWRDADLLDTTILCDLAQSIADAKACLGQAPVALLRPVFLHLRDARTLARIAHDLVGILCPPSTPQIIADITVPPYSGEVTPEMRRQFRRSLASHLFGWDTLLAARMKLVASEFCRTHSDGLESYAIFSGASGNCSSAIWHHVLRTIIRHIGAVVGALSSHDVRFVRRVVLQASLPNVPPDLVAEAMIISEQVDAIGGMEEALVELCPACHTPVPLQDTATDAVCANGHVWTRCSITSFVLSTPMVRTCTGCRRKAFLPISPAAPHQDWLPAAVHSSWLVHDILDATQRCLFCGSSFVSLL